MGNQLSDTLKCQCTWCPGGDRKQRGVKQRPRLALKMGVLANKTSLTQPFTSGVRSATGNGKKIILVLASNQISKLVKWETNVGWITVCLNSAHLQGGASVEMPVGETSEALTAFGGGGGKGSDVGKEFCSR